MKKLKTALIVILIIVLVALIVFGIIELVNRNQAKKLNLISLDTSSVPTPLKSATSENDIQLSDISMHYAVYGTGKKSIILIHGNACDHTYLEEAARYLGTEYTVYALDSRCHGESSDPGKISYELMAKDVYEFINKMKLDKPYIIGHSDGAIVALTIGYTYPDSIGAIVSCGANSNPSTFKPHFTWFVKINNLSKPNKLNDLMLTAPDFTKEKLAKIKVPTYVVSAEHDIMWLSDTKFIHEAIPNSKIAITKNEEHSSYMTKDGKKCYVLSTEFFNSIK